MVAILTYDTPIGGHVNISGFTGGDFNNTTLHIPVQDGSNNDVIGILSASLANSTTTGSSLVFDNGSLVTSIGSNAFANCYGFNGGLTLPTGLQSIGDGAFFDCYGFTGGLVIPNGVTGISIATFNNCYGFNGGLTLPTGLQSIGDSAFNNCYGFTGGLVIPDGVTGIGNNVFLVCYGFNGGLTLPIGLQSIGDGAFAGCTGFNGGLTLPTGLQNIGSSAFNTCYGFTGGLVIPNGVTNIGDDAFGTCYGFNGGLTLPTGLQSIGKYAFYNCHGFTGGLVIPDGVTGIGENAFTDCYGFNGGLTLPTGLQSIGISAFQGCTGFTGSLVIPDGVTGIGDNAFLDCNFNPIILNKTQSLYSTSFSDNSNYVLNATTADNININFMNSNPVTLHVGSNLPPGITLFGNLLSGTPTTPGTYNFVLDGSTMNFTMNVPGGPICLLENCDVLVEAEGVKEYTYKNITKITKNDRVIGYFSRKPVKILEVLERVHKIADLDPNNMPFVIRKSHYNANTPDKDIHLSGHHRVIIKEDSGKFLGVQVFKLGFDKVDMQGETVRYFHIRLEDRLEGLIVNNLAVESCQD